MTPAISHAFYPARWHSPRDGATPIAIIAHGTAGRDSRAYLQRGGASPNGADRKVSIHVLIQKDGTIYRMVDDERAAHHAGGVLLPDGTLSSTLTIAGTTYRGHQINVRTLGFELENMQNGTDPYTDAQLLSMGWQIAAWRQRWGMLPVIRHATIDPGRRSDTRGLTVDQIEAWVQRAATNTPYRFRVAQVAFCDWELSGLAPTAHAPHIWDAGTVVDVDAIRGNVAHAGPEGFVPLAVLERRP